MVNLGLTPLDITAEWPSISLNPTILFQKIHLNLDIKMKIKKKKISQKIMIKIKRFRSG